MIEGHDKALIFTSTKEACLAACLNEKNFVCRSAEYNYVTLQGCYSVLVSVLTINDHPLLGVWSVICKFKLILIIAAQKVLN